jgi:hypothetical protein
MRCATRRNGQSLALQPARFLSGAFSALIAGPGRSGPGPFAFARNYANTLLSADAHLFVVIPTRVSRRTLVLQRHFRFVEELAASSLAPERFLYLLPEAFFAPSVVAVVDRLPWPELPLG